MAMVAFRLIMPSIFFLPLFPVCLINHEVVLRVMFAGAFFKRKELAAVPFLLQIQILCGHFIVNVAIRIHGFRSDINLPIVPNHNAIFYCGTLKYIFVTQRLKRRKFEQIFFLLFTDEIFLITNEMLHFFILFNYSQNTQAHFLRSGLVYTNFLSVYSIFTSVSLKNAASSAEHIA